MNSKDMIDFDPSLDHENKKILNEDQIVISLFVEFGQLLPSYLIRTICVSFIAYKILLTFQASFGLLFFVFLLFPSGRHDMSTAIYRSYLRMIKLEKQKKA